jgi:amino acid transporter
MQNGANEKHSLLYRIRCRLIGRPRNIRDPLLFQTITLIALLSWIGLGADGLSSSSYGPEAAFNMITDHPYIAVFLAIATAATVFIISYTYSKIIEEFPHGGGGYIVATHTLGRVPGVVSGSALLVDYVLTIAVSIAACGDAVFSFMPAAVQPYRLFFKLGLILFLIVLNLRGVKESVKILAPIFLLFLVMHVLMLGYGIFSNVPQMGTHAAAVVTDLRVDVGAIGLVGVFAIFLRAFSLGAGTYTGIEAVSNGLQIMREPRVKTGKRTMMYMALSLSLVAGSILLCYYLTDIHPVKGQTLNAVLATTLFSGWPAGYWIALVIIFSEALLLIVASQTGFIDGPRVMANMAVDSWFPKKFAALSERLTIQNGVLVMGVSALLVVGFSFGNVSTLIIMYAINVFVTFSLSQLGMTRLTLKNRGKNPHWRRRLTVFLIGFAVCFTILIVTVFEKFSEGGWITLVITGFIILICYTIYRHYQRVKTAMKKFDEVLLLSNIHLADKPNTKPIDPTKRTAVLLVRRYDGFSVNTFLQLIRNFPGLYTNIIFTAVAEVDSGSFKGKEELDSLERSVRGDLMKYVKLARALGFAADYRMDIGTDVVATASALCEGIAHEFPTVTFFTGKLCFRHETIFHKVLHNETALAVQRRLQWEGLPVVIIPVPVDL